MGKFYTCIECGKQTKVLKKGLCWTCDKKQRQDTWMEEHLNGVWHNEPYNIPYKFYMPKEPPTVYTHEFFMKSS